MALAHVEEYREPDQVRSRLAELGLTPEILLDAIAEGEAARASATPLDPLNAGGQFAYIARIRGIRSRLLPLEWTKEDPSGCPVTVSPDGRRQIMVATGDDATGLEAIPSTQYRKGIVMRRAVANNQQLGFWPEFNAFPPEQAPARETWVLLVRRIEKQDSVEVRSEISLPARMENNHPTDWQKRIILPVLNLGAGSMSAPVATFDDGDEIDVPIARK